MILKGRVRADGGKLAAYLLSTKNEEVRVLDLRGTCAQQQRSAQGLLQSLGEMNEMGKMTRAKSSLYHLAINPSDRDRMTEQGWQTTIERAEKALGLQDQPRAVVSHRIDGKEHLHVVWSRVDVEQRKCVEHPFSHRKLCQAAREIEIELGLQQTPKRARGAHRLKQHIKDIQAQQDARSVTPRAELNATVAKAWHEAGSAKEFKAQIEAAGLQLAHGKRGVVVMNEALIPHSIPRCVEGIKLKEVHERLGELLPTLPKVEELQAARAREKRETQKGTQRTETTTETEQRGTAGSDDARSAALTARQAAHGQADDLRTAIMQDGSATTERAQGEQSAASEPAGARRARNMTGAMLERELTADNDNAKDAEAAPIGARRAKDMTAPMLERELTADNDNGEEAEPQQPKYTQSKGETDEQFAARLKRMEARDRREAERAKEQPKLELKMEPRGRGFSY